MYSLGKRLATMVLSIAIVAVLLGIQGSKAEETIVVLHGEDGGVATGPLLVKSGLGPLHGDLNLRLATGPFPAVNSDPGPTRVIDRIIIGTSLTVDSGHAAQRTRQGFGSCSVEGVSNIGDLESRYAADGLDVVGLFLLGYNVQMAFVPNLKEGEFPTSNTQGCLLFFLEEGGFSMPVSDPTDANRFILKTNVIIPPDFTDLVSLFMIGDVVFE